MDRNELYKEALAKISYVERAKREVCTLLDWLVDVRSSQMYVTARDFDYACEVIREAIDDLFHEEIRYARNIRDNHE